MNWWICDLPLCIVKDNKNFVINNSYFNRNFNNKTHRKMEKCKQCVYNSKCIWIIKSYLDKFWEDEFSPLENW